MTVSITPEWLALIAGALLSLLFSYVPGLSDWFAKLDGTHKRLVMLALLAVVTGVAFGLGCAGVLGGVACDQAGAVSVLYAFVLALVANQGVYNITPRRGVA